MDMKQAAAYLSPNVSVEGMRGRTDRWRDNRRRGIGIPTHLGEELCSAMLKRLGLKVMSKRVYVFRADLDRYLLRCRWDDHGRPVIDRTGTYPALPAERIKTRSVQLSEIDWMTFKMMAAEYEIPLDDRLKACGGLSALLRQLARTTRKRWRARDPERIAELAKVVKLHADDLDRDRSKPLRRNGKVYVTREKKL